MHYKDVEQNLVPEMGYRVFTAPVNNTAATRTHKLDGLYNARARLHHPTSRNIDLAMTVLI